jgi:Tol biopolymer transport system component
MFRKLLLPGVGLLLHATTAGSQTPRIARPIFSSDSMSVMIGSPTVSPDERWLVFVRIISNQETRVMIRPFAGGEPRELVSVKGNFANPRFNPQGDRIVMASDLPRRDPGDDKYYFVIAPFDTRTGTLSAPVRQLTLDAVDQLPQHASAFSPDGKWVAYMAWPSRALKVVPIEGGNARTLTDKERGFAWQTWSPDGRAVLYETREGDEFIRKRVSIDGGPPVEVLRSHESLGALTPDNRYSVTQQNPGPSSARILRVFAADGHRLGEVAVPARSWNRAGFTANGKYLMGTRSDAVAPIKLVPVSGGPIRQLTKGDVYDWAGSWTSSGDAVHVWTEQGGRSVVTLVTRGGEIRSTLAVPDSASTATRGLGEQDGSLLLQEGPLSDPNGSRVILVNLKDGSRKELVRGIRSENGIIGPGGMYYGLYNGEAYYQQAKNGRIQVRAINLRGESRLIGELPTDRPERSAVAVFQSRIVYAQGLKDSVRLQLVTGPGRQPTTLGTFPKNAALGEISWSHDGRQLTTYLIGAPQTQLVYRFDAAGAPQGPPLSLTLPFEYWYEVFWQPDGSGFTMIAQPRGRGTTVVALVKLADPEHPILLTKDDPHSTWGHSLSPDGKWVAYPSEEPRGSSIYLIDVAQLIKQAQGQH